MARREPVRGETLSLTGRYVFVRDVTDRRQAERKRQEAEEALRTRSVELEAVLETIPTAVWFTTDREMRNVVSNRRAIELLHLPSTIDLSNAPNRPEDFSVFRDGVEVPSSERCGALPALVGQQAVHGAQGQQPLLESRAGAGIDVLQRQCRDRLVPLGRRLAAHRARPGEPRRRRPAAQAQARRRAVDGAERARHQRAEVRRAVDRARRGDGALDHRRRRAAVRRSRSPAAAASARV